MLLDRYTSIQELYLEKIMPNLQFIYIEKAWALYNHDITAKMFQGEIGTWLMENIGEMGNARNYAKWAESERWAWGLGTGKFNLPLGIYFADKEDLLRFALTYSEIVTSKRYHS